MEENSVKEKMGILEICVCLIMPVLLVFVDYGVGKRFNFSPLRILVIFSTLLAIFQYLRGKIKFVSTALFLPFILMLVADLLSIVNAQSKFSVVRGILIQTGLIIIYYLIVHIVRLEFLLKKLLNFLVITTLFACSFAYMQKYYDGHYIYPFTRYLDVYSVRISGVTPISGFRFYRPSSFFVDVNTFALFLVTFLPLFFSLFFYSIISGFKNNMRYVYAFVLAVEGPVFLMTLSRNNWIGGTLGILTVLILEFKSIMRNLKFWKWIMGVLLIAIIITSFYFKETGESIYYRLTEIPRALTAQRSYSDNTRLIAMKAGFQAFKQHPIFGIGTGAINFTLFYQKYYDPSIKEWDTHCWPAKIAAETGIIGLFASFLFIFFLIREVWRARKRALTSSNSKSEYWRFFFSGGMGGLVVLLVTSLFGQNFVAETVYFFIGLMIASSRIAEKDETFNSSCES